MAQATPPTSTTAILELNQLHTGRSPPVVAFPVGDDAAAAALILDGLLPTLRIHDGRPAMAQRSRGLAMHACRARPRSASDVIMPRTMGSPSRPRLPASPHMPNTCLINTNIDQELEFVYGMYGI